jgi:murein DD-endopeptidase MepM/ murein hydrolase activator NlpD
MLSQQTAQQNEQTAEASSPTNPALDGRGLGTIGASALNPGSLYSVAANDASDMPSGRPVDGVLTQKYHNRHFGLDLGVPIGTNVKSTMPGKVIHAGWNNEGYGNLVIIENGPYQTYYAHLSSIPVKVGDTVNPGQVIGISGSTGNSTGPHLHYEIRRDGVPIDPTSRTLTSDKSW